MSLEGIIKTLKERDIIEIVFKEDSFVISHLYWYIRQIDKNTILVANAKFNYGKRDYGFEGKSILLEKIDKIKKYKPTK